MIRNRRSIAQDVLFLTPSYPKSKAIFELSGFETSFFCYRVNPENRLAPRNSKNMILELILLAYCTFPYVWPENPSSPDFLGIPRDLTFRKSAKVIRDIRRCDRFLTRFSKAISLMAFHFPRSQLLMWTRAVLEILIRRPMTQKTWFGKNLTYCPRCFTSYPLVPQK